MRNERPNVVGIILMTTIVTAAVLVGGWWAWAQYLAQPAVTAAPVATAPVAPPRRKAMRGGRAPATMPAAAERDVAATVAAPVAPERADSARPSPDADSSAATRAAAAPEGDSTRSTLDPAGARADQAAPAAPTATRGDARGIVDEAQRRSEARFYHYDGLLQSFDAKDRMTEKRWTFDREGSHGASKAVLRFTAPAEVKGVSLLIVNHPDRASDQWMWTPAIERDRRIALQDRSTRFFGTDFSFEDLEELDVDQYDYALVGTEPINGTDCWQIQFTPKPARASQYTRLLAWIRQDNYAYARFDNFVNDEIVRRLTNAMFENVQGIWTARRLEMADLRRHTRTRLTLEQVKYNVPMKDEDFTLQAIRR